MFNLAVKDYNINELKNLLNLQDPFTLEDIVNNENVLREKLLMDNAISRGKKKEILKFLSEAKDILMKKKKQQFTSMAGHELMGGEHVIDKRPHDRTSLQSRLNAVPGDRMDGIDDGHNMHRLLCLDSRFRNNYYTTLSTNYTMTLPTVVKNVVSMELSALEFPSTYYQISKSIGNNFFWIVWTDPARLMVGSDPLALWYYIAIPDGNYKRGEIEIAINEQLLIATQPTAAAKAALGPEYTSGMVAHPQITIDIHSVKSVFSIAPGNVTAAATVPDVSLNILNDPSCNAWFEVLYNRSRGSRGATSYWTQTITPGPMTYSGGVDDDPPLHLDSYNGILGGMGWILGYRLGEYKGATAYVSEGCYDAWGTKYLYVVIDDFNKNVNNFCIPSYNQSLGTSNILARISTNAASSDAFSDGLTLNTGLQDSDSSIKKRYYFGPVDISRLHIQVLDELGRIIDLNSMDYSMAVNLVCLYD